MPPNLPTFPFPAAILTRKQFKENPDAWLLVDKILQEAQYPQTKCMLYRPRWLGCHGANCDQI